MNELFDGHRVVAQGLARLVVTHHADVIYTSLTVRCSSTGLLKHPHRMSSGWNDSTLCSHPRIQYLMYEIYIPRTRMEQYI